MKKILLVFAIIASFWADVGGQVPVNYIDRGLNKADYGVVINPATRFRPIWPGFVSYLIPNSGKIEYDSLGATKEILFKYFAGTGLSLSGQTFSLNQWPGASLGDVGANSYSLISPTIQNGLGGNPVVYFDKATQKLMVANVDDLLGSNKYGRFVPIPLNEDSPGVPGDYSFDADYRYEYMQINSYTWKWRRWLTESKFNNSNSSGVSPPINFAAVYNSTAKNLQLNWGRAVHPLAWELFQSLNDTLNFSLVSSTIEGSLRQYSYPNPLPNTRYYFKLRAAEADGVSQFVSANVLTPPAETVSNWLPVYNTSATTTTNTLTFTYSTQETGGDATFWTARSNISENATTGWTQAGTTTGHGAAGVYTKTFSGLSGTTPIYIRAQRNGTGKLVSVYSKSGPYYLQGVNQLQKPTLSVANNNGTATLTAGGPDNVQYFWRSRVGTGNWTAYTAFSGTSKTANGGTLQAGNTYSFQIYYSSGGAQSPVSDEVSLTIQRPYVTPVIVQGPVSGTGQYGFNVLMTNSAQVVDSVQIWTSYDGTNFTFHWALAPSWWANSSNGFLRSWSGNSPSDFNDLRVKVRAKLPNGSGWGAFSNTVHYIAAGGSTGNEGGTLVEQLRISVSSVAGQPTKRLVSILNPVPGSRTYNWSVYQGSSYKTHEWDVVSNTGSFVVELSGKLTAGQTYTMYVADKANTAASMQGSINFTYNVQDVSTSPRILVFGNSILRHPPAPELSWPNDWGMAATEESKDFFHQFKMRVQGSQPDAFLDWFHLNSFETGYWNNYDYEAFKYRCNFDGGYDVIVFRLGDNVDDSQVGARNLQARYSQLIDKAREVRANTKFIISTSFWDKGAYNNVVRSLVQTKSTAQSPVVLADLSYMIGKTEYMAYADAPAASPDIVKQHPGDAGHQGIAEKLFDAYKNLYSTGNPSQITNLEPFMQTVNEPWGWTVYMSRPGLKVGIGVNPDKTGLHKAGALVFLSDGSNANTINNYDQGRQLQQSYYADPQPFLPAGYQKNPAWSGFPWNPVQAGDAYGNVSEIVEYQAPSQYNNWTMYVKTRPLDWALNFYKSECFMESWYSFKTNTLLEVKYKLTTFRTDGVVGSGKFAEAPAIWLNRNYSDIYATKDGMPLGADPVRLNSEMVPDGDPTLASQGVKTVTYYQKEQYTAIVNPGLTPAKGLGIIGKSYIGLNANRNFLQSKLSHFGEAPSNWTADMTMHGSSSYWTTAQLFNPYGNSSGEYSFYLTFDTVPNIKAAYQQYGQAPWTSAPAGN